jgi:phosphoenolpyruvate phosphomutase/phosphonopyruvate hydrolase
VLVPTAYPQLTESDISALGRVGIVIYGNHAIRAAVGAMRSVFAQIRKEGGIREVDKILPSVKDIIELQGDDYMRRVESTFLR